MDMNWAILAIAAYIVFIAIWAFIWIADARREDRVAADPERTKEAREHPERSYPQ